MTTSLTTSPATGHEPGPLPVRSGRERRPVTERLACPGTDRPDPAWRPDTVGRLYAEFHGRVPADVVVSWLERSQHELRRSGAPEGALPELVERLARTYLLPDDAAD